MAVLAEMPQRIELTGAQMPRRSAARLFEPGGVTLEDSILALYEGLGSCGRVECPVCGGEMHAGTGCEGCGSSLG